MLTSAIGACSAVTDQWNDLIGEAPPAPAPALAATERDEVFYASVEELPMHALPSGSSDIVARLALHQRVTRIGLARGYANVTTESGIVGWVDNVNLLWRLPATPTPSTAPAAPVPPPEAEQAPAEAVVDTPVPTDTELSAAPPTRTPAAPPTRKTIFSIFSPS